jgi:hypothetical protein
MAIANFSATQIADLNDTIKPRLHASYERCSSLYSPRGQKVVERALHKGTVGGDVGMQLLFEPAMLLGLVAPADVTFDLAATARDIPFIGKYNQWLPACAAIAASYRRLEHFLDERAYEVER